MTGILMKQIHPSTKTNYLAWNRMIFYNLFLQNDDLEIQR